MNKKVRDHIIFWIAWVAWFAFGWFFLREIIVAIGLAYGLAMFVLAFAGAVMITMWVISKIIRPIKENSRLKEKMDGLKDESFSRGKENE